MSGCQRKKERSSLLNEKIFQNESVRTSPSELETHTSSQFEQGWSSVKTREPERHLHRKYLETTTLQISSAVGYSWWTRNRPVKVVKVRGPRDVSNFAGSPLRTLYWSAKMRKRFQYRYKVLEGALRIFGVVGFWWSAVSRTGLVKRCTSIFCTG